MGWEYKALCRQGDLIMSVLRLVEYRCRETVTILKALLALALAGKLRGLMLCYKTDDGVEESILTGVYKGSTDRAASSSLRMSIRLMKANGELE
jgi:hypothetical protein